LQTFRERRKYVYLIGGADGVVNRRDLGVLQVFEAAIGGRREAFVVDLAPASDGQVRELKSISPTFYQEQLTKNANKTGSRV